MVYRLFISHRWRYDDYQRLVAILNRAAPEFRWHDYSVSEERGFDRCSRRVMKDALGNQIQRVHAVVVIAGKDVHYSEWMQSEIRIARDEYDKPLIWVRPRGISQVPVFAREAADKVVLRWSTRSIIRGIERGVQIRRPDFLRIG